MEPVETIVREVLQRLRQETGGSNGRLIPAEMSARHVHLSDEDLKILFGLDRLEEVRAISQPGQFLSGCRVRLIGPKGILENVAVLGPTRKQTQVEVSMTDARALGIQAPVRLSGDLKDAAVITLQAGNTVLTRKAAIVAQRHLHMTPEDAAGFGVKDGQCVRVRVLGSRPLILEGVPVRVTAASSLALHMDTDEANAAGAGKDTQCQIIGVCESVPHTDPVREPVRGTAGTEPAGLPGKLITEADIRTAYRNGCRELCVRKGQLITPLARDTARTMGMKVTYGG